MMSWALVARSHLLLACCLIAAISLSLLGCNETTEGFLSSSSNENETAQGGSGGGGSAEERSEDDEEQLDFAEAGLMALEGVAEGTEAEEELFVQQLLAAETTGIGSYADARPPSCCNISEAPTQMTWAEFEQNYASGNISQQVPVVIPCGFEVSVTSSPSQALAGLQVMGNLKFENTVDVSLTTAFILVCGKFHIGTEEQGHASRVEIILAGKVNVTWPEMHNSDKMLNFGTAGFVTYGGDTVLRGASCGSPSWARLSKPVDPPAPLGRRLQDSIETSQSSVAHSRYGAAKGADGDTATDILTNEETRPWWQMKLPSSVQEGVGIVRVILSSKRSSTHVWFFSGAPATRLSNIQGNIYDGADQGAIVGISNEPCGDNGDHCNGIVCGRITTPRSDGRYEVDCQGETGRYIYVLLPGANRRIQLSEVDAFPPNTGGIDVELAGNAQPNWKAGDKLVITSTSFNARETEEVTVSGKNGQIFQTSGITYRHDGCDPASDSDCYRAAEVASINRNIVIRGGGNCENDFADTCVENCPRCGHFMIAHTKKAFVCGVEFTNLGQPGIEGRYPLHIHMPGTAPEIIVKDNALHHNHQRGVVMHGVIGATFESNVCYITNGHCFMLEDGGEEHNIIMNNIGILPKPLIFRCSHSHDFTFTCPARSDDSPNAFWIPNTNNYFIGNVAVVTNIGYRIETRHVMGTTRLQFPREAVKVGGNGKLKGRVPIGIFKDNVAHSCLTGWFNYPRFMPTAGKIEGFLSWRNQVGISIHNDAKRNMIIERARLFDVNLAARGGTGTARIALITSQLQGRPDHTSGPFGVKGINKNEQALNDVYTPTDAYTRNWARCFGNYRLTDIDRRALPVLTESFRMLEDPAFKVECNSITEDMPAIINQPELWPQDGASHTRCTAENIFTVHDRWACEKRAIHLRYPYYQYVEGRRQCGVAIMCNDRVTGTGYDWRIYKDPEAVIQTPSQITLWGQDGDGNSRCVARNIIEVSDRAACQWRAMVLDYPYYQFVEILNRCAVFEACNKRVSGVGWDWRIYHKDAPVIQTTPAPPMTMWPQDGASHTRCSGVQSKNIVTVSDQEACQQRAIVLGSTYYQYAASNGKCAVTNSCSARKGGTGYDWQIYHKYVPPPDITLWLQDGASYTICTAENVITVGDRASCQQAAVLAGYPYYQYVDSNHKCAVAETCDDRRSGTSWEWQIYKKP